MNLQAEMTADFAEIQSELSAEVMLAGVAIPALVSEGELSEELQGGGFIPTRTISVRILKSAVARAPKVGEKLTCDGASYRISNINSKPGLPFLRIECEKE